MASCLLQVNYLGHWLLTHQLLAGQHQLRGNQLKSNNQQQKVATHQLNSSAFAQQNQDSSQSHASGSAAEPAAHMQGSPKSAQEEGTRVVMLTSLTQSAGRIRFDDLHAKKSYSGFHRYADSKLAILLAVREFAQRMSRQVMPIDGAIKFSVLPL